VTDAQGSPVAAVLPLESAWLEQQGVGLEQVQQPLEQRGWRVEIESWEEALELPLGDGVLERWFGLDADYRQLLRSHRQSAATIKRLEALFRRHRGVALPQLLRHTLLRARRTA
jgi:putative ATPase